MIAQRFLAGLALSVSMTVTAEESPSYLGQHENSPDDRRAIETVLSTYAQSVSTGNEVAFESLLLGPDIPFAATRYLDGADVDPLHVDTHRYHEFRDAVFRSGKHYSQTFHNVRIEQDGVLAQVSLDFITRVTGTRQGGYGFKTLQLVKVGGHWKIASEFYTAHSLPDPA